MTRNLSRRFDKVVLCSGHMIDAPTRRQPRFPATKEGAVQERIAQQLSSWSIGENDLALCGGANGADMLFAEECLRRSATVRLLLAQNSDDFVRASVAPAGKGWVARFRELCGKAEVETLPASPPGDDSSIYERVNLWLVEVAQRETADPSKLYVILVWDEKISGDGPGGTADFEKRMRELGSKIAIINPITIR